jgi:hypothetical protein
MFINSLCGNHHQKLLTKVRAIRANVKRYGFWDTCVNFVHMVEPILVSLRAFDGKQPCMGRNVETLYLPPLLFNAKGGLIGLLIKVILEGKSGMEINVIWLIMSWEKPLLNGELLHVTLRSMLLMRILVTIMLESQY